MTTISLSEAKARLSELADEVFRTHERLQVTRNGRDYVVLMSSEDLASLEATMELLADHAAQGRIRQAEEEFARGEFITMDELGAGIEERRRSGS